MNGSIKKQELLAAMLCFLSVSILAGCDAGSPSESESGSNDATAITPTIVEATPEEFEPSLVYEARPQIDNSIVLGLDADMTSGSASSGEAIRRGIVLAVDHINGAGGLLGRPVELIVRDHRGNPDRGKDNIAEFGAMRDIVAVVGGIHTPVAVQELPVIHDLKLPYLGAWAAGTQIVANDYSPNFVFRVSVRDEYAGGFLVKKAIERGHQRFGLLLERTAWGRSNEKAMTEALAAAGIEPVAVEWLNWGETDLASRMQNLQRSEADVVLLVCNSLEGVAAVRAAAELPPQSRPEIISHWGVSGGDFFELAGDDLKAVHFSFLQTFSFVDPKRPANTQELFDAYRRRFPDCQTRGDVFSPVGTAQAYEIVLMLAAAVERGGSINSDVVHRELESLRNYEGLIRDYAHPFPRGHHDALNADDFFLAKFDEDGTIIPVKL